jgi:hypothetical protein
MRAAVAKVFGLILLTAVTGCGGGGSSGGTTPAAAAQTGTVTLSLSDGVIEDYDQVLMDIAEVRFIANGGQDILVLDEPVRVDFLRLENFSELLIKGEIVTGTYAKIRLILEGITLRKLDPETGLIASEDPVQLNGQRKIDINPRGPFTVRAGEEVVIDLEVDLDKSIHVVSTGASERFRFRPVIFAAVDTEAAFDKLFRIQGTIDSVDATAGTFHVCEIRRTFTDGENRPEPADVCVTVDPDDSTPFFDLDANPFHPGLDGLAANDPVVAYGKFDEFASGDRLVPAVVAVGAEFTRRKGLTASEFRPVTSDFDLGITNDVCAIDPDPLRVALQDGAPAFVETATGAVQVDLAALPLLCRRAEAEGRYDESDPEAPYLRSVIALFGDSRIDGVEVAGTLTDRTSTADIENDFDLDTAISEEDEDEVVVVPAEARLVKVTSGADGDTVEDIDVVPTGVPVTVYGVRREGGVIEASFVLQEVESP